MQESWQLSCIWKTWAAYGQVSMEKNKSFFPIKINYGKIHVVGITKCKHLFEWVVGRPISAASICKSENFEQLQCYGISNFQFQHRIFDKNCEDHQEVVETTTLCYLKSIINISLKGFLFDKPLRVFNTLIINSLYALMHVAMKVSHCCFYDNISYKCSWNHIDIATNKKHLAAYVLGKWLKASNEGWTHWLVEHELCHLTAGRNQMHYTCVPKMELKTQEVR